MKGLYFESGADSVLIVIGSKKVMFSTKAHNFQMLSTIDGLKLNKNGILKEFPDLKDKPDDFIYKESIRRFKDKIKLMKDDDEIAVYLIDELKKMGYKLKKIKINGFRDKKI